MDERLVYLPFISLLSSIVGKTLLNQSLRLNSACFNVNTQSLFFPYMIDSPHPSNWIGIERQIPELSYSTHEHILDQESRCAV